jgi:type VI secretion system secreted protein Hcp
VAFDAFLKIDGIKGESRDDRRRDEIEVLSFSWGESQTGTVAHGGGGGAGKVAMQDFHFTALFSKASPALFLACASGQHLPEALLSIRGAGENPQDFLKWRLSDILVSSYQTEGIAHGDAGRPTDQFSLNFAQIEVEYSPQKPDGSLDQSIKAGWDLKKNAPA